MTVDTKEELVTMPIPIGALPAVHEVLAKYYQERSKAAATEALIGEERVLVRNVNGDSEWSQDEIRELYRKFRSPIGRAVIRCVAHAMGGPVLYGQMAEAAEIEVDQLRAQLAWFSKYAKQIKGVNHWPLELEEDPGKPKGERYTYRMPRRVAWWWLEVDTENQVVHDPQTDEYPPTCKECEKPMLAVAHGGCVCTNPECDLCFMPQEPGNR